MIEQYIKIKTDFEGTHCWDKCNIKDVMFLKNIHRHKIYISVKTKTKDDRQIEFFMFKFIIDRIIQDLYGNELLKKLGNRSMETIGHEILKKLQVELPQQFYEIEVSEDNQVSTIIIWNCEVE